MGRGCLERPWWLHCGSLWGPTNVSEMMRCSKTLMWEKEMEQMSSPGARSSDFPDSLVRLPCVVHQKSMWSPILTILIGGCVFRHINLSSYILHCWWVHKLALLFLHLWDYKGFYCISKQKLTHFLMACGKQMKLEFGSFHFDNCYWYKVYWKQPVVRLLVVWYAVSSL